MQKNIICSGRSAIWTAVFCIALLMGASHAPAKTFSGSESCRDCHEKFYKLWAPSRHGTAMQPYTPGFAREHLLPQPRPISIEGKDYTAHEKDGLWVVTESDGGIEKAYPISHALGGKYVYYFLTPMEKGRLQTLPLALDIKNGEWFDMAGSGVRHTRDAAVSWKDAAYTFNTACHGCHVSQLRNNFDPETGAYETTWKEPGINCETCHGPSSEHNRVCRTAPEGTVPGDLKILGGRGKFTVRQNTDACASCHAQMIPLTGEFMPGDRFYDHFDLVALEDEDSYADGRDLGENYTATTWSLSPCVQSGKLGCLHCHTSSGRFRQKDDPNTACAPCHEDKVASPRLHTLHKSDPNSPTCISCHMHKTVFARMDRSDHSMLPPVPAATKAFGSPNACNGCHGDKDADWADRWVRKWRQRDFQAPVIYRAGLIAAARKGDWTRLPEMTAYILSRYRDAVFAASLIRLMRRCRDSAMRDSLVRALSDPSPLVRSAAAQALGPPGSYGEVQALVQATSDDFRLVRIRSAASLAGVSMKITEGPLRDNFERATREYLASLSARPDLWTSSYNLGNYHLNRREYAQAILAFDKAHKISPRAIPPMVNAAMARAGAGDLAGARDQLLKAVSLAPDNAVAVFNLGLVAGELGDDAGAEAYLRKSLALDPKLSGAAYNLSVLLKDRSPTEAVAFAGTANELTPSPRYSFNLAYVQNAAGRTDQARRTLKKTIAKWPGYADAYIFLVDISFGEKEKADVLEQVKHALDTAVFSQADRVRLQRLLP